MADEKLESKIDLSDKTNPNYDPNIDPKRFKWVNCEKCNFKLNSIVQTPKRLKDRMDLHKVNMHAA